MARHPLGPPGAGVDGPAGLRARGGPPGLRASFVAWRTVSPTEQFHVLVGGLGAPPLDVGCLLIAAHASGAEGAGSIVSRGLAVLDELAATCPGTSVDDLRRHLFGPGGFVGNRQRYDDPRNSYLDHVLASRRGIPITLSIVMIETGRRLGLELDGIGMPGHFLVGAGSDRYVDAFDGGRVLDAAGCRQRFAELAGPDAPWSDELLAPVEPRAVLARVLANLRQLFGATQDLRSLDWVLELRLGIPGVPVRERADRASVLAALGRYDEAASQLELLARASDAVDRRHPSATGAPSDDLRARAARLRARLN